MNFKALLKHIQSVHSKLQAQAVNAVNQALTIRNWLIGYYIVEYEQNGEDRAKYGDRLIDDLASGLSHIKGIDRRSLFRFRQFYLMYPQIGQTLSDQSWLTFFVPPEINRNTLAKVGTVSPLFKNKQIRGARLPNLPDSAKVGTASPLLKTASQVPPGKLLTKLSYSHLELLLNIDDPLKRTFYELECIKGTWSVRELKRQISSLYYERSALSAKPEKLAEKVRKNAVPEAPADIIKNIYAFEFLDLKVKDVVEETDLETALLNHLQEFILELGTGFCFEARQKRILIGKKYYFIDLVFYHRLLKCHALIDLKIGEFSHEDIAQLNTYLNYYKEEITETGDNHPVGILMVAEKDHALVKYATAGMDKNLFVQQYLVQLPSVKVLEAYINKELNKLT